jgi:hypothetical protein
MPTYTVKQAFGPQEWQSQHGPMHSYSLQLEGVDQQAEINVKPTSPAPQPGQSLELVLEPHPRFEGRLKAKRVQQQQGRPGGGRSPEENARIVRQHSQSTAINYARLMHERGVLPETFKLGDLEKLVGWFYDDAMQAKP